MLQILDFFDPVEVARPLGTVVVDLDRYLLILDQGKQLFQVIGVNANGFHSLGILEIVSVKGNR